MFYFSNSRLKVLTSYEKSWKPYAPDLDKRLIFPKQKKLTVNLHAQPFRPSSIVRLGPAHIRGRKFFNLGINSNHDAKVMVNRG